MWKRQKTYGMKAGEPQEVVARGSRCTVRSAVRRENAEEAVGGERLHRVLSKVGVTAQLLIAIGIIGFRYRIEVVKGEEGNHWNLYCNWAGGSMYIWSDSS